MQEVIATLKAVASREEMEEGRETLASLGRLGLAAKAAAPAVRALLETGLEPYALEALGVLGEGLPEAEAALRSIHGEESSTNITLLAAQKVLRLHGKTHDLGRARRWLDVPIQRYGFPKVEDAMTIRRLAAEALLALGDDEDKARVRSLISSPYRVMRAVGLSAFGTPPRLVAYDPVRIAWCQKHHGVERLLAALAEPTTVYAEQIVESFAETKDKRVLERLKDFVVAQLEKLPPSESAYQKLDPDAEVYCSLAEKWKLGPRLTQVRNAYVRKEVLGENPKQHFEPLPPGVRVTRFDRHPMVFQGAKALYLAPEVDRVLVVGRELAVVEPHTETRVVELGDGSDVQAAALSGDGARVALARGRSVQLRTLEKEERVLELPAPVSALAFSPGGEWLAAAAANRLHVFTVADGVVAAEHEAPGTIRGVVWPGAKKALLLAEDKTARVLTTIELGKKPKVSSTPLEHGDILALSGKTIAVAADRTLHVLDAKLAPKTTAQAPEAIEALAVVNSKTLVVAAGGKAHRVVLGAKQAWSDAGAPLFAAATEKHYAIKDARLHRIHSDDATPASGFHTSHPQAICRLPDGRILTGGWDGRLLAWTPDGGRGTQLFKQEHRIDDIGCDPEGKRVYFNHEKTVRCLELATGKVTDLIGAMEEDMGGQQSDVESLAVGRDGVAWGDGSGSVHLLDFQGVEKWVASVGTDDVESVAVDGEGNVWAGTERGEVGCIAPDGKLRWSRKEHGVDLIACDLYGNPHRCVAEMTARGPWVASLASDSTARVYAAATGERVLRIHERVGIFNVADFSPDATQVAFSCGGNLLIHDVPSGERRLELSIGAVGAYSQVMAVCWLDAKTVVLATEDCSFYRVELP